MTEWYPSISEVRLLTVDVLAKLRENRAAHRAKFEEAMEGYKTRIVEVLEDHIDRVKANDPEKVFVDLPMPQDHTKEYDRVIEMLEWSMDNEVVLNQHEFRQFIQDEWGWKQEFSETYTMYTA